MTIVKTPEELSRAPLAYALTLAMIYGLAEICFWVCVGATGLACYFVLLNELHDVRDFRRYRRFFLVLGSSSLLFYGYLAIWHPYLFLSICPDANSSDIASVNGMRIDRVTALVGILVVMALVGAAPLALIGLFTFGGYIVFMILVNWLLVRAGRRPLS